MADTSRYDVVIVGAGIAGGIIAHELGRAGKRVLILDAGPAVPTNRGQYMENFFLAAAKTPEAPYPPLAQEPGTAPNPRPTILGLGSWKDPARSYLLQPMPDPTHAPKNLPFSSTYERVGGGTTWHWLGTSLRLVPHDLKMYSTYKVFGPWADWPLEYSELQQLYGKAEGEIGVAASVTEQAPLEGAIGLTYPQGYEYPLPPVPPTVVDDTFTTGLRGMQLFGKEVFLTPTPQGRNTRPYDNRPACAGNTNCIPICPIAAKYDATVTLNRALNTGNVEIRYQSVARKVLTDANGRINGIEYVAWKNAQRPWEGATVQTAVGTTYVLAAHAMENAKLLLLSRSDAFPRGVANSSDQVGRNLMDHVIYLSWALMPEGVYPYRGPLSTSGIESLRDGPFRSERAAFRIELGNEGWNFPIGDPYVTLNDLINGTNSSRLNPITPPGVVSTAPSQRLGGPALAQALNDRLTRQVRMAFLLEQAPQSGNRILIRENGPTDGLGIPRPSIEYGFDKYTLDGFVAARKASSAIYQQLKAIEFTDYSNAKDKPGYFEYEGQSFRFFGAGHVVGTHRMGSDRQQSVVDASQRSHDHENLWIVGSGSFPTVATPNPTLTLAALAFKTAANLQSTLGG
jgi:glucose dehydrogenase